MNKTKKLSDFIFVALILTPVFFIPLLVVIGLLFDIDLVASNKTSSNMEFTVFEEERTKGNCNAHSDILEKTNKGKKIDDSQCLCAMVP